jgi:hypothetical protein
VLIILITEHLKHKALRGALSIVSGAVVSSPQKPFPVGYPEMPLNAIFPAMAAEAMFLQNRKDFLGIELLPTLSVSRRKEE